MRPATCSLPLSSRRASNAQLSEFAAIWFCTGVVYQVVGHARDRQADGDWLTVGEQLSRGPYRRFGRTVHVIDGRACVLACLRKERRWECLAADDDQLDSR